ncbi:hypothetical protein CLAIMM_15036 [Cladophialophora immunda]|nr:hypothetical protein CLAIMM_15036 [Cladophialophora immunda]
MTVEGAPYAPRTVLETLFTELPTLPSDGAAAQLDAAAAATFVQSLSCLNESILAERALWRDTFALTGSLRTFYTPASIMKGWSSTCATREAKDFAFVPDRIRPVQIGQNGWVDVQFTFKTEAAPAAHCRGLLSLIHDSHSTWKIWMIRTVLDQLEGTPNVDKLTWTDSGEKNSVTQANGMNGAMGANGANGLHASKKPTEVYDCVIVGAGQAGLSSAGRLEALGVSYIVLERNAKIGDNWKNRYDSARLHTPREFGHLPFDRTFSGYQEYLTKDDLARGYQDFARRAGVAQQVWLNANLDSGSWDDQEKSKYHHAAGVCGQTPTMPNLPGRLDFQGTVIYSADYKSPDLWKGKAAIVVGSANTAHDVAQDMVEAGLSCITMVQRARTYVLPGAYYKTLSDMSYNTTIPTSEADFEFFSTPYAVLRLVSNQIFHGMASQEPARFDALEAAGFRVARYGDIWYQICERAGGHHMDVGCSELIVKGLIKMKSDALPSHYTPTGLAFSDGTEIPADVIVFCTGFVGNAKPDIERIFGQGVATKVEDYWGLNEEGELRGAFKPMGHPALWYMGGTVGHARYYSRFVALQIKASLMGNPLPQYK